MFFIHTCKLYVQVLGLVYELILFITAQNLPVSSNTSFKVSEMKWMAWLCVKQKPCAQSLEGHANSQQESEGTFSHNSIAALIDQTVIQTVNTAILS